MYRIALNTAIAIYRKSKISVDYYQQFPEHLHLSDEKTISENEERLFWALRKLNDSEKPSYRFTSKTSITGKLPP